MCDFWLIELTGDVMGSLSGLVLVSRTCEGDELGAALGGLRGVEKELRCGDSRAVAMEVGIRQGVCNNSAV